MVAAPLPGYVRSMTPPARGRRGRRGRRPPTPRRLRYHVAVSLDGFIATPDGGYDWLLDDPQLDLGALAREFDTAVMGRRTFELVEKHGLHTMQGFECVVFSRTRAPVTQPGLRIVNSDPGVYVTSLKREPGGDIWLFGGGELFRSLLDAGVVDTVELAVMPVLLGDGIPVLPAGDMAKLRLVDSRVLPESGIVALAYTLPGAVGAPPGIPYVRKARRRSPARGTTKARGTSKAAKKKRPRRATRR